VFYEAIAAVMKHKVPRVNNRRDEKKKKQNKEKKKKCVLQ